MDVKQFLLDHISGADTRALAEKYGISQQSVAARLRYARERGDMDRLRKEINHGSNYDDISFQASQQKEERKEEKESIERNDGISDQKPDRIFARFGTLQDKHNFARLRKVAYNRIAAHEAKIGRKDPGFRIAQELWIRKERARMLGLTVNDLRRMRGISV